MAGPISPHYILSTLPIGIIIRFPGKFVLHFWACIGKIAAHSAYEMFSWYKYLIVSLVFSHLGFWSGSLFLIAPFPDLCLLVLLFIYLFIYLF